MWKLSLTVVHLLVSKVKLDHCKNLFLNPAPILISDGEDEVGLISEGGGVSGEPGGGGQWEHGGITQDKGEVPQTHPNTHCPPARAGAAARTLRGCWVLTNAEQFPVLPAFLMNVLLVNEH